MRGAEWPANARHKMQTLGRMTLRFERANSVGGSPKLVILKTDLIRPARLIEERVTSIDA